MPIKFRCTHCRQLLGISRAKAGSATDCPTCGRAIRVPDLNGRVAPLPPPRLNLEDDDLVHALDALAGIEKGTQQVVGRFPPPAAVAVLPEPQQRIAVTPELVPHDVRPSNQGDVEEDLLARLSEIPVTAPHRPPAAEGVERFASLILIGLCLASLACGIWLGRVLFRGTSEAAPAAAAAAREPAPQPAAAPRSHVRGTVRYQAPTGDRLVDRGARILALPLLRVGTVRLAGAGFRVGASDADQAVLAASATALQGGFTTVDAQGQFQLDVAERGRYGVLIASRYQPGDDTATLPVDLQAFLDRYFEQPGQVLGKVRYDYREVDLEPGKPVVVEVDFDRVAP
ncbi:hypothetical protein [Planctomicrobium sp. SH664]|uniref:hypothetical protein n=1 Tax=Planctomicrobium sp. SH664 TaxID=3448125 RepID=UPI003F5C31A0